ncbi:MAG TPA: chitobiase/beta-hexosaminidase C-terminal domain-containing protein [Verrucomicrobiae bacterium]|jgi:uncharacterized repeat protein (TIGR03806 family)
MKIKFTPGLIAFAWLIIGPANIPAGAESFGINFIGDSGDSVTSLAGIVSIANWNNISAATFTSGSIQSSDGSLLATLNLSNASTAGSWHSGVTSDGGNGSLLGGYIDAGSNHSGGISAVSTISGLTGSSYKVILYIYGDASHPGNSGDGLPNYSVNGITYYAPQLGNGTTTFNSSGTAVGGAFTGFVRAKVFATNFLTATANVPDFGNYIEIDNVVPIGGIITLASEAYSGSWRSPLDGIEIIAMSNSPLASPPLISPASNPVYAGTLVTLSETASGQFPLYYQWQTDGGTGGTRTNIPGALATNLVINTSSWMPGTYRYDIIVSNSVGVSTSSVAALNLSLAGNSGISVQFVGNGTGLTPDQVAGVYPQANWNLDNQDSGGNATNLNDNTGAATTAGVTVMFTAGHYASGDDTSSPDGILMSGGFWSGGGYTATVNGVSYADYDVYVYMLNDNNPNRRYGLTLESQTYWGSVFNGNGLVIPPYIQDTQTTKVAEGTQMAANYVKFSNVTGSSFTINGQTPDGNVAMMGIQIVSTAPTRPIITSQPVPVSAFPGGNATFSATVYGTQPLSCHWQFNHTDLTDQPGIGGSQTNVLHLSNLNVNEAGSYALVITNAYGSVTSSPAALTVLPPVPPFFTQQPTPAAVTNYAGGLVTFTAAVDGAPPIALQWQQNGTNVPNATASSLTLSQFQLDAAGDYTLIASNYLGATNSLPAALVVLPLPANARPDVLTYHYDNTRQGQNTNEYLLTPANVNPTNFGKLFSYPVDGYVYAQPLIVNGINLPGKGVRDVLLVVTMHDSVYAFDADSNTAADGGWLWHTNLGVSAPSPIPEYGTRYHGVGNLDVVPEEGMTGTPVIDPATGTLYVDAFTREVVTGVSTNYFHRIHALNITNGTEQSYSPVTVAASVPGTGVSGDNYTKIQNGTTLAFSAVQHCQRPALTLAGGVLYVCYGSHDDTDPYHGWVLGYNATNLALRSVFCTTPNATTGAFGGNAGEGALWMGGNGLSVDANTNLYFETGNGSFSANTNGGDYADSFVKLSTVSNQLAVADYFTPYNQLALQNADSDLGSGGPLLLPDSVGSAAHPHLIVGAGKEGKIFLLDRDNMGRYDGTDGKNGTDTNNVQELPGAIGGVWDSPAYWNHYIFYHGNGDVLKAFYLTNGLFNATPASQSATSFGFPGATPTVSANGANNGIVWDVDPTPYLSSGPAVLHAYNATNVAIELYNSSQNLARDNPGGAVKMVPPVIAGGKVYVGAEYAVSVFGTAFFLATPSISPVGGYFTGSVNIALSDASTSAGIYYTLDGTTPTSASIAYTHPFLLTSNALVQAIAILPGAVSSAVASASFVNTAALGNGVGLLGQYWTNTTSTAFTNVAFTMVPTLTRTDAVVNFNWGTTGPAPVVGGTNFTVRWTGCVQPQFHETYTLTTIANDGVRLWINGQLLVNDWNVHSTPVTNHSSLALNAQQLYNVRLEHFQNAGNASIQLLWSSPSTPFGIVPQTQLYPFTNPPPTVVLTSPANNASYTAAASVTVGADADAPYNPLGLVSFYANGTPLGSVSNAPYTLTATGLTAGSYALTAVAVDGSGLSSTSTPVNITVTAGSGQPYGLTTRNPVSAYLNLPSTFEGALPPLLSQTGVFSNTPSMTPVNGLIAYAPNTVLWSDGAVKTRYFAVPKIAGPTTPDQQIGFAPTGSWNFPAGSVFVKTFELNTDTTNPNIRHRLETRLLVRDANGAVYGVTYKWRADNSDADLLAGSLSENITITNATGTSTQTWYYPSPADCLTCHTPVNHYVLGVNSRQLNGNLTYPATGATDNQLRTLNRLGLFNPAFDEASIGSLEKLSALTNVNVALEERARSYLDVNCAVCHLPGGTGITFDARYDTPLASQNLTNYPAAVSLGYDHAQIIAPKDIWRSMIWQRMNTTNNIYKMPNLARNLIDTNAVQVMADWINSLPGTLPALAPPVITPNGGSYVASVNVTLSAPNTNAMIYYTLDGSLPTTNSLRYTGPFNLNDNAIISANDFAANYNDSVAATALFQVEPLHFTSAGFSHDIFRLGFMGVAGSNYVLQATTNFSTWTPVSTNLATNNLFILFDANATNYPYRFYRIERQ